MAEIEQQEEEKEVLLSIYEGDPAFKQISPTVYQYKYGNDGEPKSFLLEISWGKTYPTEKPNVNLNTFYNKHIKESVKQRICEHLLNEADQFLGEAMTYTLFESAREHLEELTAEQPESPDVPVSEPSNELPEEIVEKKAAVKKEQLSKSQKRKQWDRVDGKGERPRGWDWVDIVKHLSQTGPKEDIPSS
ncbi:RWD domain-containing protein 4 [Macrosteles quadrilineatus]|uniref:RWD domain-containing protein 4 n=1 Tax=Macrosteles quadrilineatus TaxID=74068 RepID=UPI0023E18A29|nr:RWD domain-containing protein 4 [Macrosteles quadrilineatus]XP_054268427.1 RWD domain-containing protein 4 [Macrosteles quadrilineatus]